MDKSIEDEMKFKIQSLTKYGHDVLMKGTSVEAGESFLNAYQFSKQLNDESIIRSCSFNLGACYVAGRQPVMGLKYLELAIPPEDQNICLESFADLWYNIGVAAHAVGNIDKAIIAYEKCQVAYNELNWTRPEGECLSKLAVCYHLKDRLNDSKDMYKKAQIVYKELGDQNNHALCLVSETNVLTQMGDIDSCAKVLDVLLDVCQEIKNHHLQAKIYHDVGLLYISEQLYESALECFEQSLKCLSLSSTDNQILKATILQNIGAVSNYMKEFDKAIRFHLKAVDIYGILNDRRSQTQVFSNLAFAYCKSTQYNDAITAFQQAIQAAKDCGDKESQFLATEGLAAVWFRLRDYQKSVTTYKDALTISIPNTVNSDELMNRVVGKLTDAMRYQLQNETPAKVIFPDANSFKKGRPRFSRDNRQSLIAKGLEHESSLDDSSDESSGSDENEIEEASERGSVEQEAVDGSSLKMIRKNEELGMQFNMNSTLNQIPRADKEYYLATVEQQNAKRFEGKEEKVTSKMCLIM